MGWNKRKRRCQYEQRALIISDYQMPITDSLRRIRTTREHGATIPILIISTELSIADAILTAGANPFLPTFFPVAAFVQILRTLLPIAAQGSATALRFATRMYQGLKNKPRVR